MPAMTPSAEKPKLRPARNPRFLTVLEIVVLVVLFSGAALQEARHLQSLTDPGVWLQLRTGSWIIDNHSVPRSGLFSRYDALSWADSSWGSQVMLAAVCRIIGLRAIPVMQMVLRILVAIGTFLLAGGRRGGFWWAVIISFCAQVAMFRPATQSLLLLLNAVLLLVELWGLFASRAIGRQGLLSWMPLLVLVWANLDWHFVVGLLALLLFLGTVFVEQTRGGETRAHTGAPLAPGRIAMIAAASCIASLLSPSSLHSYAVASQNWFGRIALTLAPEMKSMNFHTPANYVSMLLVTFAFFALGRQSAKDRFKVMLLAVSASVGFAFQREAWMMVVVSVAILGDVFFPAAGLRGDQSRSSKLVLWVVPIIVLLVLVLSVSRIPSSTETLLKVTAQKLPVRACDFVMQNHLPAPIFNELSWGGFIAWYLPTYPVNIDDRYELYGEENLKRYYQVTTGGGLSSEYFALASAKTFILSKENGLVRIPEMYPNPQEVFQAAFPGFHEVYRDDLAVVLSKQD
jgi:hypothetical protein